MTRDHDLAVIGNRPVASVIFPVGRRVWFCFSRLDAELLLNVEADFGALGSAFLACLLWYIDALASAGSRERMFASSVSILTHCNHLGLLPEDIAPDTGMLSRNFPQTYCQAGLISTAMRLSRSREEGMWHAL